LRGPGRYTTTPNTTRNLSRKIKDQQFKTSSLNKSYDFNTARKLPENGPGPGHYNIDRKDMRTAKPQKIFDKIEVGFSSTTERGLLKSSNSKKNEIGPGAYIDVNNPIHSSVCKSLLKYAVDRGIMMAHGLDAKPFGIGGKRFEKSLFSPKDGPGPGDYNNEKRNISTANENCSERLMKTGGFGNSMSKEIAFSTTTERFYIPGEQQHEFENKSIKLALGPKQEPRNSQLQSSLDNEFPKNISTKQTRNLYYAVYNGRNIGFDSTQPRFDSDQNITNLQMIPGPGYYEKDSKKTRGKLQKFRGGFNVTEKKFNQKLNSYLNVSCTNNKVGPGSYKVETEIAKRSFNIHTYIS